MSGVRATCARTRLEGNSATVLVSTLRTRGSCRHAADGKPPSVVRKTSLATKSQCSYARVPVRRRDSMPPGCLTLPRLHCATRACRGEHTSRVRCNDFIEFGAEVPRGMLSASGASRVRSAATVWLLCLEGQKPHPTLQCALLLLILLLYSTWGTFVGMNIGRVHWRCVRSSFTALQSQALSCTTKTQFDSTITELCAWAMRP